MRRVAIRTSPSWRDPVEALSPFADEPNACLLHSGEAGWSYLLRGPSAQLDEGDPFDALTRLIGPAGDFDPQGPPFQGGVTGLACYELAARIEALVQWRPSAGSALEGTPDDPQYRYVAYDD